MSRDRYATLAREMSFNSGFLNAGDAPCMSGSFRDLGSSSDAPCVSGSFSEFLVLPVCADMPVFTSGIRYSGHDFLGFFGGDREGKIRPTVAPFRGASQSHLPASVSPLRGVD